MANVQSYFEEFHDAIKLGHFDENETLREKRKRILDRLDSGLTKLFTDKEEDTPTYKWFSQGSYVMGTGVKPLNGDYDIDIGLRFMLAKDDHPDPVEIKKWVRDALQTVTTKVDIRRNCVTVWYQQEGEPINHVDLAIYSDGSSNPDGKTYLAKGKEYSTGENRFWEESDAQGLLTLIKNCQSDSKDWEQFRRVIRYLKRWRDVKFNSGNAAPVGIGITVAAYYWFVPAKSVVDVFSNTVRYDDLEALRRFVSAVLSQFRLLYFDREWVYRLEVKLPIAPETDIFERMTNNQMADFKAKLENLVEAIEAAQKHADVREACNLLQKQFGSDFRVPPPEETGQKRGPAFYSSGNSA